MTSASYCRVDRETPTMFGAPCRQSLHGAYIGADGCGFLSAWILISIAHAYEQLRQQSNQSKQSDNTTLLVPSVGKIDLGRCVYATLACGTR